MAIGVRIPILTDPTQSLTNRVQQNVSKALRSAQSIQGPPVWIGFVSPYLNGWVAAPSLGDAGSVAGQAPLLSYTIDSMNIVRMRGTVQGGTQGFAKNCTVATLPAGFRPAYEFTCAVTSSTGVGTILVLDTGDIRVSLGNFVDFSPVSFLAEH